MNNDFIVSSLIPFISEGEVSYYSNLEIEKLTLLVSLAPFIDNSDILMKLSKLDIIVLHELMEKLPQIDNENVEKYINQYLLKNCTISHS